MIIQIKKCVWFETAPERWSTWDSRHRRTRVTLYVVLKDGCRIDSFQRYRNAQRCVRRLKLAPSSR